MAKVNVSLNASREITEHYAAGAHSRAYERACITAAMPAYVARMGGLPVYAIDGSPLNGAAILATVERKARLEVRRAADKARNEAAKAARIATATRFAASQAEPATDSEIDSYLGELELTADEFNAAREELSALTH